MSDTKFGELGTVSNPIFIEQKPASVGTLFRSGLVTGLGAGLATVGVTVGLALYNARVKETTTSTTDTSGG